ncbi:hypothetical protein [Idiomarina xiamenensis]|uniref:Uncharacterized protein n=1 Tax=Idiomarina xiamenensis 10-D-4 TaxID=740709 RepID=K2KYL8_9GAMM|nr:hypothetical protein [Idiomarina xiamenensis]EKE82800.1 hypothetical protein A10D4_09354 [Idiomarina xiamenensis 10-D-4]
MSNIVDALIFTVLVGAGVLGISSLIMFLVHKNPVDREVQQQERIEYSFFGIAGIVIMLLMWYALS